MSKGEEFVHDSYQDNLSIGKYLKALTDGFESGKISFSSKQGTIELIPSNPMEFSIRVRKKGEKNKVNIKIGWKESKKTIEKTGAIIISS